MMEIRISIDRNISGSKAKEVFDSVFYFQKLTTAIGSVVCKDEFSLSPIGMSALVDEGTTEQFKEFQSFNAVDENYSNIHLFVSSGDPFSDRIQGLTVGNIAIISAVKAGNTLWQPVIHELGHTMGLVQEDMNNYYNGSSKNHCSQWYCIMSNRPVEKELQVGRYNDFRSKPENVFCKDCLNHLRTAKLEALPWYNQVQK
ncbi:hypothetical protein H6794_02170 [Candidatus Nomurabacteria bacterium]|jgi:hypothetical protein|nr:hypothetical protein [Candidatus Saccharibacteria bacterium]MCB9839637.1 hypothetical protein [Candidatus Nomurabacteria bacterium]